MQQVRASACPYCGAEIVARAAECLSCGRTLIRGETVLQAHVAKTSAKQKRTASKLFWLGLVVTFIGCFLTASQQVELSGDLLQTAVKSVVTAFMVYMAGLVPAALNSFTPPFLGDNVGLLSKAIIFAGCAVLVWACRSFAAAKGRAEALGYLGAFGIVGVVLLILLPDKHKKHVLG